MGTSSITTPFSPLTLPSIAPGMSSWSKAGPPAAEPARRSRKRFIGPSKTRKAGRNPNHPPSRAPPNMVSFGTKERQAKIDWLQLLAIGGLMVIGVAFIYSATMFNESAAQAAWYNQAWFRQIVWYGV